MNANCGQELLRLAHISLCLESAIVHSRMPNTDSRYCTVLYCTVSPDTQMHHVRMQRCHLAPEMTDKFMTIDSALSILAQSFAISVRGSGIIKRTTAGSLNPSETN